MESKQKITIINVISIIMLVICLVLCVGLIIISTSKSSIEVAEKSVEELKKKYTSTEETSSANTWKISATENDNVIATLSADGMLTISGTGAMKNWSYDSTTDWHGISDEVKNVIIESGITYIGNNAFKGCTSLTSIEVDENNTSYKDDNGVLYTKDGTKIIKYPEGKIGTEYKILNGTTRIGLSAFSNCTSLENIEIPSGVTIIDGSAFEDCTSLTNIEIPSGVEYIGNYTFNRCTSLESIEIPSSVIGISGLAFRSCTSLKNIEIPSGVKYIENENCIFNGCSSLTSIEVNENNTSYKDDNGVLYTKDGTKIIKYPEGKTGEYRILDGTNEIWENAFDGCHNLNSVEIPQSVTSIFGNFGCFMGCSSLESIEVHEDNPNYMDDNGVLYTKDGSEILRYPEGKDETVYKILDGVIRIGEGAFSSCENLLSIEIPSSVTDIGDGAFYECKSLESVKIPSSVKNIGFYAFALCKSLEKIYIPESVIEIGEGAFSVCDKVTIICYKESTAKTYAQEEGIKYLIIMDEINPKTTVEQLSKSIGSEEQNEIKDKNGGIIANTAYVTTGSTVETKDGENYIIIVKGDCNGDGKSDIQDIFAINKHRLNNGKLINEYLLAGDANRDGKTNINDIFEINKYRLGIKEIL